MKKLLTAVALATLATSSAFAATHHARSAASAEAAGSYASDQNGYTSGDPDVVVVNGEVVGRDPDANVRLMLRRDPKDDAP